MSQRNPMNERYTTDERQGKTRKSAATMKPKTKAAASVHVQSKVKTKEQKKAEQKAQRSKQAELDRKYYNPPTDEYKRLRKMWWICLIAAILCTVLSWVARSWEPEWISFGALALAYVLIIAAFYIDFSKIRKVRRAYQAEMMAKKSKEMRAQEKQQKAAAREKASRKEEASSEQPKKGGLLGGFKLGKKSKDAEPASDATVAVATGDVASAASAGDAPAAASAAETSSDKAEAK